MSTIVYSPSDIKIKINSIVDSQGRPIPVNSLYLKFEIKDQYCSTYSAVYDPSGVNSEHTYFDGTTLYVLIENGYKLKGDLQWRIGTRTQDSAFIDGIWDWYSNFKPLNITIC